MTVNTHPPTHPTHRNSMSVISQLLLTHFDQTLNVGSWDYLEQIPTVMVTFVKKTLTLATFVHISNISAVTLPILTKL